MRGMRGVWRGILLWRGKHTTLSSVVIIVAFVLLSNFVYLFITNPNPVLSRSGLPVQNGRALVKMPFDGGNSIEGNDGITKQALGVQAARQILHGKVPLWNYYEGVGAPLLGETQSAAISPFTLLLLLPQGFLINELTLEMLAGIGMYLFIKYLKDSLQYEVDDTIAITGACLYATLGTFMMLPNACFNPIAFLPWSMLGISLISRGDRGILDRRNIVAMLVFALSVALSLSAGFPEIAFINMLLVLAYAVSLLIRSPSSQRIGRAASMAVAGAVGTLMTLPWLMEFFTYISPANGTAGMHNDRILHGLGNNASGYLTSFIPNVIGYGAENPVFGNIGGFFTISCVILALFALGDKKIMLWHKILFGGWFVVGWLRIVGFWPVSIVMAHIPMLGHAAVFRYIPVSMSFCLILLACLGINSMVRNSEQNRRFVIAVACSVALFYGFMLYGGRHYLREFVFADAKHALFAAFFLQLSIGASVAVLLAAVVSWKHKKQFVCAVIVLESVICFAAWQLGAYSREAAVDTGSVRFLQQHLGTQRFDSNLLRPNYGSYFNISQLSSMDLPIPTLWNTYINKNVNAYIPSIGYLSNDFNAQRVAQDEKLGVKYILLAKGSLPTSDIRQQRLRLVYSDANTEVVELPSYKNYISGDNCSARGVALGGLTVDCSRPSQLTRLELFYPGWHAKVDGKETAISKVNNLFQQITVPKGNHTVTFNYWPQYMTLSLALSVLGIIAVLISVGYLIITF